jgi:hypothetical protein
MRKITFVKVLAILPFIASCATVSARFKLEGGASYFYPVSERMREIYGGGVNYHLNWSENLAKHWDLWAGINYFEKWGRSEGLHQRTHIQILPISVGAKLLYPTYWRKLPVDMYLNGGLKYYFVRIHDHSHYVTPHSNDNGLGGVVGVGTYLHLTKHCFINLLIDYSFKRFHGFHHKPDTHSNSLDLSGVDFGAGIGIGF